MARTWTATWPSPSHSPLPRAQLHRCSAGDKQTPRILRIAVTAATEILRLVSPPPPNKPATTELKKELTSISDARDVLATIRSDYDRAYFVTGDLTSSIYAPDCSFEDPTIRFSGTDLYERNLKLLVPFFEDAMIELKEIELEGEFRVVASWRLRTYLRLPWRPLIRVDGTTVYELDGEFRVARHVERWSVSAIEAVLQIFTPS